jgi:diguanylate cyclase (GGDEF)-like protein
MKQILMVDDVTTNIKCAEEVLKDKYEVVTAKTAKKALDYLANAKPDMILLDINLPDMDGFELYKRIRKIEKFVKIPIIFLTAETDMMSEAKGLRLGAMDYIKKPFGPDILLSRVDRVLNSEETKKSLELLANRDSLTTLWNRRYLEEYIEKGQRKTEKGIFLLLDMDNFKQVNDSFGHLMGDEVLVAFANILQVYAGPDSRVCRLGGDEFVVYMSGTWSKAKIRDMCRNLIAVMEYEINKLIEFEDDQLQISVSIGIALKPQDGKTFNNLYNCADKALYFVKQHGKRGFHFFHEEEVSIQALQKDNKHIDMMQLKRIIQETETIEGAYKVEYSGFKRIYRFIYRFVHRTGQKVQMVLFSIVRKSGSIEDEEMSMRLERTMMKLEDAVTTSLRRGDVGSRFSECQYVVILMDVNFENSKAVVERVMQKCKKEILDGDEFTINFEIQSIDKGEDKEKAE